MRRPAVVHVIAGVVASVMAATLPATAAGDRPARSGAQADVTDRPGDARAAIDITKARFAINEKRIRVRVDFRDLTDAGRVRVTILPRSSTSDQIDVRRVRDRVEATLFLIDYDSVPPTVYEQRCRRLRASWSAANDVVYLALPTSCTSSLPGYGPYVFQASSYLSGGSDSTRAKELDY